MRTTRFDADGGGGGGGPPGSPRARSPARLALIVAILLLAFGLGTAIAATYEALEDMQARGKMDPIW
jgi:hypothetical protein